MKGTLKYIILVVVSLLTALIFTRFYKVIQFEGYTTVLEIDVPDDFELTWYNDGERMEGY